MGPGRSRRERPVRRWTDACPEPSRPCPALETTRTTAPAEAGPGGKGSMPGIAVAHAPQHMQALAQANKVRLARAELKRQVGDGEISVADVVLDCPWESESM